MSERSLQISEATLRLTLAVAALAFAAWLGQAKPSVHAGPRPSVVLEW